MLQMYTSAKEGLSQVLCELSAFLGQVNFSLDKYVTSTFLYIMAIYLSMGKYEFLLFPHLCKGMLHVWFVFPAIVSIFNVSV